jgi:putative transposase
MARKPRFALPGYPQHIIQRGLDRQACFFAVEDYRLYLELMQEAADKYDCHVHAYVLMTNHVHMLVTPQQSLGVSLMVQRLAQRYVRAINRTYRRTGTLWDGRYRAGLVDTGRYLLTCMRYIELNPVRASMVSHPAEYAWSSYRHNGQGSPDKVIKSHPLYIQLDKNRLNRCAAYRGMFSTHIEPDVLNEIRNTLNQELVLGSGAFRKQVESMLDRQTEKKPKGRPRKANGALVY